MPLTSSDYKNACTDYEDEQACNASYKTTQNISIIIIIIIITEFLK